MRLSKCVQALLLFLPLGVLAGCGSSAGAGAGTQTGSIFTVATDAPLPSVVSCQIQVDGVSLNGGPNLLSAPALVDFAQLKTLRRSVGDRSKQCDDKHGKRQGERDFARYEYRGMVQEQR